MSKTIWEYTLFEFLQSNSFSVYNISWKSYHKPKQIILMFVIING